METKLRGNTQKEKNAGHAKNASCMPMDSLTPKNATVEKKIKASPLSLQIDVYGRSAMPNYMLPFENVVGKGRNQSCSQPMLWTT